MKEPREQKQRITLLLPAKLVAALREMQAEAQRVSLAQMIQCALQCAVWKWSNGLSPDEEMHADGRGWGKWDEKLPDDLVLHHQATAAAQDMEKLERMVGIAPDDETALPAGA